MVEKIEISQTDSNKIWNCSALERKPTVCVFGNIKKTTNKKFFLSSNIFEDIIEK